MVINGEIGRSRTMRLPDRLRGDIQKFLCNFLGYTESFLYTQVLGAGQLPPARASLKR